MGVAEMNGSNGLHIKVVRRKGKIKERKICSKV